MGGREFLPETTPRRASRTIHPKRDFGHLRVGTRSGCREPRSDHPLPPLRGQGRQRTERRHPGTGELDFRPDPAHVQLGHRDPGPDRPAIHPGS